MDHAVADHDFPVAFVAVEPQPHLRRPEQVERVYGPQRDHGLVFGVLVVTDFVHGPYSLGLP
jgi:hypothetical protein